MSTTGRRGGTRQRRRTETTIDRAPAFGAEPATAPAAAAAARSAHEPIAPGAEAQLLDDVATPIAGQRGLRLGRSLGGAVAGTLLVVGLAFGAALGPGGALGPSGERPAGDAVAVADGGGDGGESGGKDGTDGDGYGGHAKDGDWAGPEKTPKPDGGDGGADPTDKPVAVDPTAKPDSADATQKPKPDATAKPKPDATPKPTEKPDPTKDPSDPMWLELGIVELHPKVAWGSCDGLDFDYYKVVRSTDSTVSWPAGNGDEVFVAVEAGGTRKAYDKNAPHAAKAWYRVFCVRKTEAGYRVVNASATKGIWVPEEPTPPDPVSLALSAEVNGQGKVVLDWSACEVDGFAFYKVVKSTSNDNPSYLPWTDGSEVIAVVEGKYATEWLDPAPASGQTTWYRVQCIGYGEYGKVLLGQTAVVAVTTP